MTPTDQAAPSSTTWPVDAAVAVVRREGFDAVTMRRVGEEAGVTAMALYRHHADKDALVRATVRKIFQVWESRAYGVLEADDPIGRLMVYARVYLRFALEEPNFYDVLFVRPLEAGIHRYPEGFRDRPATTFRILADAVAEAMDSGRMEPGDPVETALGVWAFVHGWVMIYRSGRFPAGISEFSEVYERAVQRFVGGLQTATREGRTGR